MLTGRGRPLGVTVVVIDMACACREDGHPLEGGAHQGIKGIPGVALQGAPDGPHVAEGKDVLDAQLGALADGLCDSREVGWLHHGLYARKTIDLSPCRMASKGIFLFFSIVFPLLLPCSGCRAWHLCQ